MSEQQTEVSDESLKDEVNDAVICDICEGKGLIPCYTAEDLNDVDFDDCPVCNGSGYVLEEDIEDDDYEGDYY